jgi:hypothetical protein
MTSPVSRLIAQPAQPFSNDCFSIQFGGQQITLTIDFGF